MPSAPSCSSSLVVLSCSSICASRMRVREANISLPATLQRRNKAVTFTAVPFMPAGNLSGRAILFLSPSSRCNEHVAELHNICAITVSTVGIYVYLVIGPSRATFVDSPPSRFPFHSHAGVHTVKVFKSHFGERVPVGLL